MTLGALALAAQSPQRAYLIVPRDELRIQVEEIPDLAASHTVAEDGTIQLAPVGRLTAQGLSETDLAGRIRERLIQQGLRKATVTVSVTLSRSKPVLILGAVTNPGNQFISNATRLMDVLLLAGGLSGEHGLAVQVRRQAENGLSDQLAIPIRDLIDALDPDANIPIFPGDVINVAPARQVSISLLGAVKTVGVQTFKSTDNITLLQAIARAGGPADTASRKISIKRKAADGRLVEQLVDYRRILEGKDPDVELLDGDIVVVKESFF